MGAGASARSERESVCEHEHIHNTILHFHRIGCIMFDAVGVRRRTLYDAMPELKPISNCKVLQLTAGILRGVGLIFDFGSFMPFCHCHPNGLL